MSTNVGYTPESVSHQEIRAFLEEHGLEVITAKDHVVSFTFCALRGINYDDWLAGELSDRGWHLESIESLGEIRLTVEPDQVQQ